MRRCDFIQLCGLAAGSCLVPDAVARVIRETCVPAREPYLVLPRDPCSTLYAVGTSGKTDFMLNLGDLLEEQTMPTWRQYFDKYESIDIDTKEAVEERWRDEVRDPEGDPITGRRSRTEVGKTIRRIALYRGRAVRGQPHLH